MNRIFAFILLVILTPVMILLFIAVKLDSAGPFIFKQRRTGKNKKTFVMYKVRTMVKNAEKIKKHYLKLNEASGPAFKIRNDPRFTRVGKVLALTAIDEVPQLFNVLRGEMSFVGPRPLPVDEAKKIPEKYNARFSILPGMTSSWVIKGHHKLNFRQWMKLDLTDVKNKSFTYDLSILLATLLLIAKPIFRRI